MATIATPAGQLGWKAEPFDLMGVDGRRHSLDSVRGRNGVLVMFICNHCPYVKAAIDKIVRDVRDLSAEEIGSIAIMSNDPSGYPEDSFENMKLFAVRHGFTFPYVIDETQDVGRAYDAICTPDFFGFNSRLELAYRGRLDASGRASDPNAARELYDAMVEIARTGRGPAVQKPSVGCSIKWRSQ
ncbi:MAG TPA: thioredoxin family protein [Casimicrobiaceae bacterium]|jgi:peroxiredoxin